MRTGWSSAVFVGLPAMTTASTDEQRARPRPSSVPSGARTRTESPARKSPRTPDTPIASTLLPLPRTAEAAPASSHTSPRGRSVKAIQCFFAVRRRAAATKTRALVLAGEDAREHVLLAGVGDDDVRAGERRAARRLDLARHAAGADVALLRADERQRLGHDVADDGDARALRVEQAVDVREEHEDVRVDERRHHRGELVVVAELDLLDGDRVVLVEDGHGARVEQRGERGASVVRARRGRRGRRA